MKAGWEVKPLGEVCELIKRGIAPKYVESGGIVVINQKCIRDHKIDFSLARRNDPEKKSVPDERLIKLGDVLVNSTGTGTLGRVAQVRDQEKFDATVDTHVTIVRPKEGKFYPPFFGYMMRVIEDEIKDAGQGVGGQTELSRDALINSFSVSYPNDIEEQKRIVAVLDAAFEGLTRAKDNATTNLQNARELFEACREEAFDPEQGGWTMQRLEGLISVKHGFAFKSEFFAKTGDFVLLTPGNFFETGGYRDRGEKQKFYVGEVPDGYLLQKGDLLVAMTEQAEGLLGSCILVPEDDTFLHNQRLGLIEPRDGVEWHAPFYAEAFNLSAFRKALTRTSTGIKVRHTSPTKIYDEAIPVPSSLREQVSVAEKLEAFRAQIDDAETTYRQKLTDIADLRQSLLQKAFAGELT